MAVTPTACTASRSGRTPLRRHERRKILAAGICLALGAILLGYQVGIFDRLVERSAGISALDEAQFEDSKKAAEHYQATLRERGVKIDTNGS